MPITEHDALIVVDVQRDFLPGGALAVLEGDRIVVAIHEIIPRFQTVVLTQDWHPANHCSFREWPVHCVAGTPGAELEAGLTAPAIDRYVTLVLRKGTRRDVDSYSAFRENQEGANEFRRFTGLDEYLAHRVIRRVFVVGLARDYCVAATACDAADIGYETVVIESCTRPVSPLPEKRAETDEAFQVAGVALVEAL